MTNQLSYGRAIERAFEIKFIVNIATAAAVRNWARHRLEADPHGSGPHGDEYLTTSLYFDTGDLAVFRQRGSYARSKYRIRRYGGNDSVFLERKMRTRKVLSKRRTHVPCEEIEKLAGSAVDPRWEGAWFQKRLQVRRFAPVSQVSYHRMARVAAAAMGTIRLTVDDDLRAQPAAGLIFKPGCGKAVLPDQAIVELKFRAAMPALFRQLIAEFAIEPLRISKYRTSAVALGLVRVPDRSTQGAAEKDDVSCLLF
jgi:hypothetical protein